MLNVQKTFNHGRRRELGQATNGDGKLAEKEVELRKQGAEMEKMEKMET